MGSILCIPGPDSHLRISVTSPIIIFTPSGGTADNQPNRIAPRTVPMSTVKTAVICMQTIKGIAIQVRAQARPSSCLGRKWCRRDEVCSCAADC